MSTKKQHQPFTAWTRVPSLPAIHLSSSSPRQTPPRLHPLFCLLSSTQLLTSDPNVSPVKEWILFWSAVGSLRLRTGSEMNSCHGGDEPPGPLEGTRRASRKLSGNQDFCFQSECLALSGGHREVGGYLASGLLLKKTVALRKPRTVKPKDTTDL